MEHGHDSVAVGSISTGGNGFNPSLGAAIAVEEIRSLFASSPEVEEPIRIVVVAFERDVEDSFKAALAKMVRRVNKDLLESIPVTVLDSMLPGQQLDFFSDHTPVAVPVEHDRFGMVGFYRTPRGLAPLDCGVEVRVLNRSEVGDGRLRLEVAAGRCFNIPGSIQHQDAREDEGFISPDTRPRLIASVEWEDEDMEDPSESDLKASTSLENLVNEWMRLVRAGHERQPGQMDKVLQDLGAMPPAREVTNRALWVCALINPLPSLGVAFEVRPKALQARSPKARLEVATEGITRSIAHLNGTQPMR